VVRSGKPKRVADVRQEKVYLEGTAGILSELCVPILIGDRVFGVINAESKQLNFFTEEDERLLVTIAAQMALALEQLRLFEAERHRRQEAETLRQATAIISTSLNLRQVLENILTSLHEVVPYFSASVFLHEEDRLRIVTVRGTADQRQLINATFPATNSLFLRILQEKKPVILADAQTDRGFEGWGKTTHIHGWMGVPLIVRGQVTGYITLDSTEISAYSEEQAVLAQAFANQAAAAIENARLFENLQASLSELNNAYESTIEGWSLAMDLRDKETEGHTLRVTEMTLRLAREIGISELELIHIRRGALLHDIGKMGVPDRILLKTEGLSPQEMAEMRQHPRFAYEMLAKIPYLKPALDIPYCHHEKWDGTGYPRGLKGNEIPIAARLFALADVWDALTSDRPYRLAWSREKTKNYILEQSGKYFDPTLVAVFMRLIEKDDKP
jgi:putative nucleotidyltransferase with HDIG domain